VTVWDASLVINQDFFPDQMLTLALRVDDTDSSASAGVDDLTITMYCASPSAIPSSASSAPSESCPYEPREENSVVGDVEYLGVPLEIIYQDKENVTFSVSQTWTNKSMSAIWTYFLSLDGVYVCRQEENVAMGQLKVYQAKCNDDGNAIVTIWAIDPSFGTSADAPSPCFTTGAAASQVNGQMYNYTLACVIPDEERCPYPERHECIDQTNATLASESYETPAGALSWLLGKEGMIGNITVLLVDSENVQVAKSFSIPLNTESVVLDLKVIEAEDQNEFLLILVGDVEIDLLKAVSRSVDGISVTVSTSSSIGEVTEYH
jgi:hypothetical protein